MSRCSRKGNGPVHCPVGVGEELVEVRLEALGVDQRQPRRIVEESEMADLVSDRPALGRSRLLPTLVGEGGHQGVEVLVLRSEIDAQLGQRRGHRSIMAGVLEDGRYDVIVVDADEEGSGVRLELAVASGPHKGEVVTLQAEGLDNDPLDLLATPGTLTVTGGEPRVSFD